LSIINNNKNNLKLRGIAPLKPVIIYRIASINTRSLPSSLDSESVHILTQSGLIKGKLLQFFEFMKRIVLQKDIKTIT
jgi:hypothetical protein